MGRLDLPSRPFYGLPTTNRERKHAQGSDAVACRPRRLRIGDRRYACGRAGFLRQDDRVDRSGRRGRRAEPAGAALRQDLLRPHPRQAQHQGAQHRRRRRPEGNQLRFQPGQEGRHPDALGTDELPRPAVRPQGRQVRPGRVQPGRRHRGQLRDRRALGPGGRAEEPGRHRQGQELQRRRPHSRRRARPVLALLLRHAGHPLPFRHRLQEPAEAQGGADAERDPGDLDRRYRVLGVLQARPGEEGQRSRPLLPLFVPDRLEHPGGSRQDLRRRAQLRRVLQEGEGEGAVGADVRRL